jgi:hypothetical protein
MASHAIFTCPTGFYITVPTTTRVARKTMAPADPGIEGVIFLDWPTAASTDLRSGSAWRLFTLAGEMQRSLFLATASVQSSAS